MFVPCLLASCLFLEAVWRTSWPFASALGLINLFFHQGSVMRED